MLQNFEVFLPLVSATSQKLGRFLTTRYHYFQVIYSLAPIQIKSPGKVSIRPGSVKGNHLRWKVSLNQRKIIEALQSRCDANGIVQPELNISVGDQVKIESGPLTNFICKVEKISESKRVWVLLELMQQKHALLFQ